MGRVTDAEKARLRWEEYRYIVADYVKKKGAGIAVRSNATDSFGYSTAEDMRAEFNGEIEYDEYDDDDVPPTEEELAELKQWLTAIEANDFSKAGLLLVIEKDLSKQLHTIEWDKKILNYYFN